MNIECNKTKLESMLGKVSKLAYKHITLPVLSCVYIETQNQNTIVLRTTNLDIGIEVKLHAKVLKEGSVAVPAGVFVNALSSIKDDSVVIESIDNNIKITSKKTSIVIKCMPYEDFPAIPKLDNSKLVKINSGELVTGLKSVWYSASNSTIKPELNSIYIYKNDSALFFVSTDSFRLAEKKINIKSEIDVPQVLIPSKNVSEIIKLFDGINEEIEVIFEKNQVAFITKDMYVVSRLVDGSFPDYKQIIPKNFGTTVTILKSDLINSIKTSNIFSDNLNQVRFLIDTKSGNLNIESKNNDVGEYKESIQTVCEGDDLEINFNNRYVMECMQSITSDSVVLRFAGLGKPLVIQGAQDNGFVYIVMPMNK